MSPLKAVYGPLAPPVVFRIVDGPRLEWEKAGAAGAVAWEGGCGADCASAAAAELLDLSADAWSALSEACDWLADYLAGGPRAAREVLQEARAAGLSGATMRRTKRLLGVRSVRPAADSAWMWSRG